MATKHQSYPARIKTEDGAAGDHGTFEAVVSVFGNVDKIGDRVVKGAFAKSLRSWTEAGDPIPIIWAHEWRDPKAHIGQVLEAEERDDGLWVKGRLDIDATDSHAPTVWRLLKDRRVKEFSFAYDVVDEAKADDGANELRQVELLEVGPCLKGMNPATQLLGVKAALAPHKTGTSDGTWDGPANRAALSNEAGADTYRQAFAWVDPDGDPDTKTAYSFIHHEIGDGGRVGAANMTACTVAVGVLNGGRGVDVGAQKWSADRAAIHRHLASHLRDGDREVPELRADDDHRAKAGRVLSTKNEQELRQAFEALGRVLSQIEKEDDDKATSKAGQEPEGATPGPGARSPADLRLVAELIALDTERGSC